MRNALWIIFIVTAAVLAAMFAELNHSHVTLYYAPYRVDMALNLVLLGLFLSFFLVYGILRVLFGLINMPARAALYRRTLRMQRAQVSLQDSIFHLLSGRFARAERSAKSAQMWHGFKEPAALMAARAAHEMHEYKRRDAWLAQVNSNDGLQAKAAALAEMQVEAREADAALQTIAQLQNQGARHIHLRRIALRAHQQLQNWAEVLPLVRSLEKRQALHPVVAAQLKQTACEKRLESQSQDAPALLAFWQSLTSTEKRMPRVAEKAARILIRLGRAADAQKIVEDALKTQWEPSLVRCYGECVDIPGKSSAIPLIQHVETWLKQKPNDADLHYALGCLCRHQKLWGKAQGSFEASLCYSNAPNAQSLSHLALAQLAEKLERPDEAQHHFRQAALLSLTQ